MDNCDFGFKDANVKLLKKTTDNVTKSNKCNQCDFASSRADTLKTHLIMHSGEKSNKCSQCDYASSHSGHLRLHLKTHSGEKLNKCNQCDFASVHASALRTHLTLLDPAFFGSLKTRGGADLPPPSKNGGNGWEVPKLSWNLISYQD